MTRRVQTRPRLETRIARSESESHGSNEWAIAASRSASDHALLMSNSHLQWGDIHTYFEVQLTAPGVTSYGAVWVGFPVLRQCFTEYVGWTQTTNNPAESDLYRLVLKENGYVLDGQVKPFETRTETIPLRVPPNAPEGTYALLVSDANAMTSHEQREMRQPFVPRDLDQLVRAINGLRHNNHLYARLIRPEAGAIVGGEYMQSLPPSVLSVLGSGESGVVPIRTASVWDYDLPTPFALSGSRVLSVSVER